MSATRTACLRCISAGHDTGVACYEPLADDCSRAERHDGYPRPVYAHDPRSCPERIDPWSCGCEPVMVSEERMADAARTGLVVRP